MISGIVDRDRTAMQSFQFSCILILIMMLMTMMITFRIIEIDDKKCTNQFGWHFIREPQCYHSLSVTVARSPNLTTLLLARPACHFIITTPRCETFQCHKHLILEGGGIAVWQSSFFLHLHFSVAQYTGPWLVCEEVGGGGLGPVILSKANIDKGISTWMPPTLTKLATKWVSLKNVKKTNSPPPLVNHPSYLDTVW